MLWGSGYDAARAYIEVEHKRQDPQAYWTEGGLTQQVLKQPVTEEMRGGFTVRVTQVRENRAYLTNRHVDVPWTNKNLTVKWERFVSKLEPGQKETYTAVVTGPDAKKAVAEMVAGMYDASLDAYLPHHWMERFGVFRQDYSTLNLSFENLAKHFNYIHGQWPHPHKHVDLTYRGFPGELTQNYMRYEYFAQGRRLRVRVTTTGAAAMIGRGMRWTAWRQWLPAMRLRRWPRGARLRRRDGGRRAGPEGRDAKADNLAAADRQQNAGQPPASGPGPDLNNVSARKNLNETAFFFPHLVVERRRRGPHRVHRARGAHEVEVHGLRPRQGTAQRVPQGRRRHGEGPDGAAEPAAVPARGRHAGVHRRR